MTDLRWRDILRQLVDESGYRRPIEVRQCPQILVPMTWGLVRPVILVPAGNVHWSDAAKRSVLLHELGHIRRGDCLVHLLGRLAGVAYWFHPLVWLAAKQLRKTSEQAADDLVLSANIAPPDYAQHLLAVAAQVRGLHWFGQVALPMASPSDLEGRVLAILDPTRNHRSLKRKTCYALMILAAAMLIPCAIVRFGYAQSAKDPASIPSPKGLDSQPVAAVVSATVSGEKTSKEAEASASGSGAAYGSANRASTESPPPPPPPVHLSAMGKVLDASGKPVAGAAVCLRQWPTSFWMETDLSKPRFQDILAQCRTNAQGEFRFQDVVAEQTAHYRHLKQQPWDVVAIVPGSAIAWQHLTAPEQAAPIVFQLQPEAKITGQVLDGKGRPLEGVDVSAALISLLGSELFDFTPTPEFLDLHQSWLAPQAKTGADGRVTLGGLPPQRRLRLDLQHPGRAPWLGVRVDYRATAAGDPWT